MYMLCKFALLIARRYDVETMQPCNENSKKYKLLVICIFGLS